MQKQYVTFEGGVEPQGQIEMITLQLICQLKLN